MFDDVDVIYKSASKHLLKELISAIRFRTKLTPLCFINLVHM